MRCFLLFFVDDWITSRPLRVGKNNGVFDDKEDFKLGSHDFYPVKRYTSKKIKVLVSVL